MTHCLSIELSWNDGLFGFRFSSSQNLPAFLVRPTEELSGSLLLKKDYGRDDAA